VDLPTFGRPIKATTGFINLISKIFKKQDFQQARF